MPDTVDLDSAAEQLYAGTREEFTARRKELAKAARAQGDQKTAAAIDKLAKPTTSAWLANQLARDPDADLGQVAELGDALREAHAALAGAELRTLSQKRTALVATLVKQAGRFQDAPLTEAIVRELEEIFTTAVADPEVARVLLAGRLTSAKELAAVAAWPDITASSSGAATAPVSRPRPAKPKKERSAREEAEHAAKVEAAREELERARGAVKEAEADRAEEERILAEAQRLADEATDAVRRVYEELDAAEAHEKEARRRVGSASRSVKDAERRASQAWRSVQQAERALDELGGKQNGK
ncbi:coiled-coil domain-containing protein [Actinophytocola xanthii]|uniref:Uncharacterized protein n=1 Tax=Actinophytocola xanthii TaxID=1912961 RepID=A0A1Q8C8U1_9PSEU|nr:hypothetical protein [Actinophytocola xanthii]OLF10767.1 hypothetical protein BU204_31195 [Actinophytocola xanthii]